MTCVFWRTSASGESKHLNDDARVQEAPLRPTPIQWWTRCLVGYEQMLGRRFEGGVDLSGGQWQKIALARAYMRDAQVLILDEPTATLDARAEYEVFLRFAELTRGRMAVLISHRFSTVRMAERILVLENGRILEQGSHEQLVALRRTLCRALRVAGGGVPLTIALRGQGYSFGQEGRT